MASDSARFDHRTALVTGGGSGIGREAALLFAARGARVVIADIAAGGGESTAKAILEGGGEAVFVRTDVTRADEVAAMVDAAVASFGGLDCAVNSAGTATFVRTRTHEFTEEEWRRVIDVNLTGVWLCMKREIEPMLQGGGGAIVNLSSIYGLVAAAGTAAYTASKHAVAGLTKTAALDYAKRNIRVNALSPGYTRTAMVEGVVSSKPEIEDWMVGRTPLGRMGTPREIAEAAVWLCSDAAAFVSGVILPVDGGVVAQ
ncbi:MAG: glucose 1-dehydrogenase [Immundisolibacterales bacterium]|nr:glucose 1-dehydrogenase [Immundisolibacterales bacterium]